MSNVRALLAVFIVISLVSMQARGIHLHVNAEGAGGLHGTHIHESTLGDHGHFGDTDVSLFDVIRSVDQPFSFVVVLIFTLLVVAKCQAHLWTFGTGILRPRHRFRWRPPLRAPPTLLS